MSYQISFTKTFEKDLKKLSTYEQKQVKKKLEILIENPDYPSLRTKRIQGTEDLFECSVNMNIRVIWKYSNNILIIALDVGHHDILKKF